MNAWSTIEVSSQDPEIIQINILEKQLSKLPHRVVKIRELITRFEVCHFKYQRHLEIIKLSIHALEPMVDVDTIGSHHIQYGEKVLKKDTTGKSLLGQKYVWAIENWLKKIPVGQRPEYYDDEVGIQVQDLLGTKKPEKVQLIRLLLARLTGDWNAFDKLQQGGRFIDLEYQACRMDICHYAFPKNLILLLKGIGQLKPIEKVKFEGCGSYDIVRKESLEKEFHNLNEQLQSFIKDTETDRNDSVRRWLLACLAKTIKENICLPQCIHLSTE